MSNARAEEHPWKQRATRELKRYWITVLYLAVFFTAFSAYERLILDQFNYGYLPHGTSLLKALILAKVIAVGDALHIGRRMEERALIVPTLYKTLVFALLAACFKVIEHAVIGMLHGKGLTGGITELALQNRYAILAKCVIVFTAFIPFFAFKELGRMLGEGSISDLFFRKPGASASRFLKSS